MTPMRRYEPRVRIALAVLVLLLLVGPAIALRNCVSSLQAGNQLVAPGGAVDDNRLVKLRNGSTMLLGSGSINPKVVAWLELTTSGSAAFEIADTTFKPGLADPTVDGSTNIAQLAQVLKADRQVRANVIVAREPSDETARVMLERSRAARIDAELVREGVPPDRVSAAVHSNSVLDDTQVIDHPGQESRLFIVLSR